MDTARIIRAAIRVAARSGGEIAYRRGPLRVVVQAAWGDSEATLDPALGGTTFSNSSRDFLCVWDDLSIDRMRLVPQRGDFIDQLHPDGTVETWVVTAPGAQSQVFQTDQHNAHVRIHAKRVTA